VESAAEIYSGNLRDDPPPVGPCRLRRTLQILSRIAIADRILREFKAAADPCRDLTAGCLHPGKFEICGETSEIRLKS